MAILQLFITVNYCRRIIGFLRVNCILLYSASVSSRHHGAIQILLLLLLLLLLFTKYFWHWIRPNPTHGWNRPMSIAPVLQRYIEIHNR